MKKYLFSIFLFLSIIFLIYSLINSNYLAIPRIYSISDIIISELLLFTGFLFNGVSWTIVLAQNKNMGVKISEGIVSTGLSIFGKYIPGKLWIIFGRSEYIAQKYSHSRKDLSVLSFETQVISLWTGLIFGLIGVIFIEKLEIYGLLSFIIFILISIILFSPRFFNLSNKLLNKIFHKDLKLKKLSTRNIFTTLPYFIINWLLWCLSFFFLAKSMIGIQISFTVGLGFALAGSIGILAIFAPGGIGVREGILTGYLAFCGINLQQATTIALTSRLWFLTGEIFIFLIAVILRRAK